LPVKIHYLFDCKSAVSFTFLTVSFDKYYNLLKRCLSFSLSDSRLSYELISFIKLYDKLNQNKQLNNIETCKKMLRIKKNQQQNISFANIILFKAVVVITQHLAGPLCQRTSQTTTHTIQTVSG
jgi:hypothetical protein